MIHLFAHLLLRRLQVRKYQLVLREIPPVAIPVQNSRGCFQKVDDYETSMKFSVSRGPNADVRLQKRPYSTLAFQVATGPNAHVRRKASPDATLAFSGSYWPER
jgi:hypothetical protein